MGRENGGAPFTGTEQDTCSQAPGLGQAQTLLLHPSFPDLPKVHSRLAEGNTTALLTALSSGISCGLNPDSANLV